MTRLARVAKRRRLNLLAVFPGLLSGRDEGIRKDFPVPPHVFETGREWRTGRPKHDATLTDVDGFDDPGFSVRHLHRIPGLQAV